MIDFIDTYAILLYRLGRYGEAIEWENRAAQDGAKIGAFQTPDYKSTLK